MSPETIDAMLDAGASAEVIAAAWKAEIATQQKALEEKRAKDAERQRRHRSSRDVTVTGCDSADPSPFEVSPQTPLPKTPNQVSPLNPPKSRVDYQRFGDAWNAMAQRHNLPTVQAITGKRLKAVAARHAEHGEQALFSAINMVPSCPHWLGANDWLGNFDSLMRPDNFQRMIEGAYAAKGSVSKITDARVIAENKRANAELYERMGRTDEAEALRREADALERQAA